MVAKVPKAITDMSVLARVIYDPDTTPPSIPTGIIATPISSSRIDLSWTPSTDTGGSGMAGYLVFRNSVQVGSVSAPLFSDTGLAASTQYQYQIAAVDIAGNVSSLSSIVPGTTQANVGPPAFSPVQPAVAFVGIAGVRTYTDPTQQTAIGRYNWFVMGSAWEGWASSGRDQDINVKAIKAASTAPGGTLLFAYQNLNAAEEDANDPYPTYTAEIAARNWRLYVSGSSGTIVGAPSTTCLVNCTDFVPLNPSLEHPYDFGAKYSYYKYLTKPKSDSRFSGLNPGLASSSLDGIYQDNFVLNPAVNGDWNRDGTTDNQGWPATPTPWLISAQLHYVTTIRSLAPTKYVFANAGDYGVTSAGTMIGQLDGLLCESYMGKSWSWETFLPFTTVLQYYYNALASAANPHMVVFGGSYPDTNPDGTALTRVPTSGGFPPQNTQWQWARYIAATAYLGEGMPAINRFSQGYSSDLTALDWYDFYGGVNGLARGWLGNPVNTLRPATPKIAKGIIGIYGVEYQNGIVLVNPKGNGTQTVVAADIPGSWQFLTGTQDSTRDSGATFSSVSMPERDGLFLQRVPWVIQSLITGINNGLVWEDDTGGNNQPTDNNVRWLSDSTGPFARINWVKGGTAGLRWKNVDQTLSKNGLYLKYDIRRSQNQNSKEIKLFGRGYSSSPSIYSNFTGGCNAGGYSGQRMSLCYSDAVSGGDINTCFWLDAAPALTGGSAYTRAQPTINVHIGGTQLINSTWMTIEWYIRHNTDGVPNGEMACWLNGTLIFWAVNVYNCRTGGQGFERVDWGGYAPTAGTILDVRNAYASYTKPVGRGI